MCVCVDKLREGMIIIYKYIYITLACGLGTGVGRGARREFKEIGEEEVWTVGSEFLRRRTGLAGGRGRVA